MLKCKEIRKEIAEEVLKCKGRTGAVISLLAKAATGEISNEMIAQLNDLAYKGLRKGV